MITQEKKYLGYRYKESKKVYRNGIISAVILGCTALLIAIILMFIKAEGSDKKYKFFSVGLLLFCSIFFFCMIPLIKKTKKQIQDNNNYPEDAIYFENGYICILTDIVTRIKATDIIKVDIINNNKFDTQTYLKNADAQSGGSISIVTEKEKFFVPQLKNVEKVKERILKFAKAKTYIVDDVYFILNAFEEYEAEFNLSGVKVTIGFSENEKNLIYSVDSTKYILNNFDKFYEKILNNTSNDILELANEWNADEGIKFTPDIIKSKIIESGYIIIEINGNDFTVYLDDADIFLGHTIVCYGNMNDDEFSTDIAG